MPLKEIPHSLVHIHIVYMFEWILYWSYTSTVKDESTRQPADDS